ncbi:MAG TPA: hypothetical protein VH062_30530 [Polyangiaceae bacterium]|nr:hypothetical protein [Polyangiaceae bacterium]
MIRSKLFLATALVACLCDVACNEATRRCQSLMSTAQGIVSKVDGKQQSSVEQSLNSVETARAACEQAGRTTEQDELLKAKNELQAQLDYLKRKSGEPAVPKLSPDQIAALVKSGDPSCPKGQAYRRSPTQEIKCTGPQLVDMNWKAAETYYTNRGYKLTSTMAPPTIRAEYGAELIVFTFGAQNDTSAAKCIAYYPPPGMPWQEATGRLTGTPMKKLDTAKTVKSDHGEVTLRVDETTTKLIVYLGDC